MIARARHEFPDWGLGLFCTNPWCLLNMTVEQKDIRFGPYPDDKPLKGQGFYFHCPSCKKVFAIHESMLFAPYVEKLLNE
ncbi:TPA: hypothetical protein DCW61_04100 [Candidatus Uhrbacteria bacterium]|nr:hypothetical protein [Candidatus Uhrbacteria bacterium]